MIKLVSLTLENIKSYTRETIHFPEGVIFISGMNGAGKTTIIEAIGYALFDSNPFSSQKQFIKKGEKTGIITVVFQAVDDRLYRVVRRIHEAGGGSWVIYDEESQTELQQLHGNKDIKAWLADNLGVSGGLDPQKLFEDIIGVSQGKFITPFLERPEARKKIFNTILQLESYREAFDKTRSLDTAFSLRITEQEGEMKALAVRVEDLDECRARLQAAQDKISKLNLEIKALTAELEALDKEIRIQENHRENLELHQNKLHQLKVNLTRLSTRKEHLLLQLAEARASQEKVAQAQAGHEEYLRHQKLEKELDEKRKTRDVLNEQLNKLQARITVLQTQIKNEQENRAKLIKEQDAELRAIGEESDQVTAETESVLAQKAAIGTRQLKLEEQKHVWLFFNQALERCQESKTFFSARLGDYRLRLKEREELKRSLEKMAEKETEAQGVPVLEQELNEVRARLSETKARLLDLEQNLALSGEGNCPLLHMPCRNVEGGLEEYFKNEIKKIKPGLVALEKRERTLDCRLRSAREAQNDYLQLVAHKQQLEKLEAGLNGIISELKTERSKLAAELDPSRLQAVERSLPVIAELPAQLDCPDKEEYVQNLVLYQEKFALLFDRYKTVHAQIFSAQRWEKGADTLEPCRQTLLEIKETADAFWNYLDGWLRKLQQDNSSSLAALNTRSANLAKTKKKLEESLVKLQDMSSIREKEKQCLLLEEEANAAKAKLLLYADLEEEWVKTQQAKALYEPDHIRYIQNVKQAAEYDKLRKEQEDLLQEEKKIRQEEVELDKILELLTQQYCPEVLAELRERRNKVVSDKSGKVTEKNHVLQDIEEQQRLIAEKEEVQRRIVVLEAEISRDKKARELLRLVRRTLNQSGEEIAKVYRKYLGREADFIYQQIARESVQLFWDDNYEVKLLHHLDGKEQERSFPQLSGGEKMTAALAVRLALLKQLSGLGLGFFDEPTANLDENRRSNLAKIIPEVTKDFGQLFVISHDDTFDAITDNVIILKKEAGITRLVKRRDNGVEL